MRQEYAINSRRSFLTRVIAGSTAVSSVPLASVSAWAQEPCAACNDSQTDVDVLNFALTLERLELAFYRDGLARFRPQDFGFVTLPGCDGQGGDGDDDDDDGDLRRRSNIFTPRFRFFKPRNRNDSQNDIGRQVFNFLKLIRDHERAHVETLVAVIQSLGGTPVPECRYNFGYRNARGFLRVAQSLENTGVMAYDGAVALICDPDLQTAGATIATVEARHASYLNLVNGDVPFPDAFDTPKTMAEILAIAGQFIVSCP